MAKITLKGNPIETIGELPKIGKKAPNFRLVKSDLSVGTLKEYRGSKVLLNITPSIDTSICATSVRKFNEAAADMVNTVVFYVSKDLPFAQARFCGAEGIDKVELLSDFRDGNFGKAYNVEFVDGPLKALHSRAIVVVDENGTVIHTNQVPETVDEPDYEAALNALKNA